MGVSSSHNQLNNIRPNFRCTYEIKENIDYIQIINNKIDNFINEEILLKIKILNNGKKEKLIFNKEFEKKGLHTIDFIIEEKLNNMSFMFSNCAALKSIDFISFETDQVTNMAAMFNECNELAELDLSKFNTNNVTNMKFMFKECHKLKEIKGINKFITTNVTKMNLMFSGCNELENLDLSNFNTSNVTDMSLMFNNCYKLKEIKGINNFITTNVTNMNLMFKECCELKSLDLSNFNTFNVEEMKFMFDKCYKLREIKGIDKFNTINVIKIDSMFEERKESTFLNLSNFNTDKVTDISFMFNKCHKLREIKGINKFNTSNVNN